MEDIILQLEVAYTNLYQAYLSNDRNMMVDAYIKTGRIGIPHFQENVMAETLKSFINNGCIYCNPTSIQHIQDLPSLKMNVIGCLNTLQAELNLRKAICSQDSFAQQILCNRGNSTYAYNEILYTKRGETLTVADLLKVLRYSMSVAEAIETNNKDYEYASAALTVLQAIDATLNNKLEDKPVNKMLHLATSFISSVVKLSLDNDQDKRDITVTAIMLDLVIDFFCDR